MPSSGHCTDHAGVTLTPVTASSSPDLVRQLMLEFRAGSAEAARQLVDLFYPDLRRLASTRMLAERTNHTWQPTVLVHELFLELTRVKSLPADPAANQDDRKAFLGLAGFLMKRLLVHHARPLPRRVARTELSEAMRVTADGEECLVEIGDLLNRLDAIDPQLRPVVEMKVFEGLSREEIAERLGCSVRTVARRWDFARQWLHDTMS